MIQYLPEFLPDHPEALNWFADYWFSIIKQFRRFRHDMRVPSNEKIPLIFIDCNYFLRNDITDGFEWFKTLCKVQYVLPGVPRDIPELGYKVGNYKTLAVENFTIYITYTGYK